MVFSSVTFLFFFLPAVIVAYYVAPRRLRNAVLAIASLVFYVWGTGAFAAVLGLIMAIDFFLGLLLGASVDRHPERVRPLLAIAIVANVGLLFWFKYANFAVDSLNGVLGWAGEGALPWQDVLLPIGISFFTFHSLSYLIDIARGTVKPLRQPVDYVLYIAFFPQLIAGPIIRFHEIRYQITGRVESSSLFVSGAYRFAHGLGKKVLIADTVAPIADAAFAVPAGELGTAGALIGAAAYTVQIYFDFSGYSDMALGLGAMFGFRLPENFDRPYAARSITEFWRRWHMSLSRWFRDYLYIPLGGNRGPAMATYRNLVIVFLVTGLWHGAAWTFVVWGAFHGSLLLIERRRGTSGDPASPRSDVVGQVRTLALVMVGWVIFRSPDLPSAIDYLLALGQPWVGVPTDVALALDPLAIIALGVGAGSALLPRDWVTGLRLWQRGDRFAAVYRPVTMLVVLPVSCIFMIAGTFSPFLYFQF